MIGYGGLSEIGSMREDSLIMAYKSRSFDRLYLLWLLASYRGEALNKGILGHHLNMRLVLEPGEDIPPWFDKGHMRRDLV